MQSMKTQTGILLRGIVLLIAALVLLIFYFWMHKPFDGETFLRLSGAVLDLLTVSALFTIAGGFGRKVVAFIGTRLELDFNLLSRAERFALQTTFGLMLIALGALGLGMVGLFRSVFFWAPLLVLALLLRQDVRAWLQEVKAIIAAARPQSRWGWLLAAFTVAMLALALLHSLAPPYAWDGMTYHLVGPQRYLADGRMSPAPYNFYLGFPKSMEMLFSVTISLFGRDTAAAPIHFGFALIGFLSVAGLARRYATNGIDAAWVSVMFLVSCFSVWLIMGWPYVDLAVLALSALAFSLANIWRETKNERWLILMGLVCGFALGAKLTSGLLIAALGLFILVFQPRQIVRNGLFFGLSVFVAFLPWMIRGLLHYGNPIYPYLFDGLNWDADRMLLFNQTGKGMINLDQAWQLPLLPFTATIFGIDNTEPYGFTVNPWLFTLPFVLLLLWKWTPQRARFLICGSMFIIVPVFIFWGVAAANAGIAMQMRLMIVVFPVAAVLGALTLDALSLMPEKPVNFAFIVRGLITVTLLFVFKDALTEIDQMRLGSYLLGNVPRSEFLFLELSTYPSTIERLDDLPDGSQVRFLWEPRSYYCPPAIDCIPDVMFDEWSRPIMPDFPPEALFDQWHSQGDDYVLFFRHGYNAYASNIAYRHEENALVPAMLEQHLSEVWTTPDERYTLYTWPETED